MRSYSHSHRQSAFAFQLFRIISSNNIYTRIYTGNAKVTCVNPINLAAEELYNCAGEGDRAVQCTPVVEVCIESNRLYDDDITYIFSFFQLTLIPHSFFLLVIGGATIQIGRAQECCEGYICEPGNVKVTCTKKENVAMEDLRVCAAEVRHIF